VIVRGFKRTMTMVHRLSCAFLLLPGATTATTPALRGAEPAKVAAIGVGAKPVAGAETIIDGSRQMLDQKWT
jgi:hypothetical protein